MCLYDFFANLAPGWVNAATVLGAVLGLVISGYAIWLSKRLSDEVTVISNAIKQNTIKIQEQTTALEKHTEAIHNHTKILRLDNIRYLYELSKGQETYGFWHFKWRFETFDRLSITVQHKTGDDLVALGGCELFIQGFSNAADHVGFERRSPEFYKAKVGNIQASEGKLFPFAEGDIVACFDQNLEHQMISKGTDPYTMEPKYPFLIGGLGHHQIGHGTPNADAAKVHPRIKDF